MKFKKIAAMTLVASFTLSMFTVNAAEQQQKVTQEEPTVVEWETLGDDFDWDSLEGVDFDEFDFDEGDWEDIEYTFDMLKEELKEDVSKDDLAKAEKLFDEAMALEEKEDWDAAWEKWDDLYEMDIFDWEDFECEGEVCDIEPFEFEDLKEWFKEDVSKDDLAKAEKIFDEVMALEEAGDYEAADEKWAEFEELDLFEEWEEGEAFEIITFEDMRDMFRDDLSDETLEAAEKLFDEAMALEEKEDFDGAWEKWDALFSMDLFDMDVVFEDVEE